MDLKSVPSQTLYLPNGTTSSPQTHTFRKSPNKSHKFTISLLTSIKKYIIETKCTLYILTWWRGNLGEDSIKNVVKQGYSMVIGSSYIKEDPKGASEWLMVVVMHLVEGAEVVA